LDEWQAGKHKLCFKLLQTFIEFAATGLENPAVFEQGTQLKEDFPSTLLTKDSAKPQRAAKNTLHLYSKVLESFDQKKQLGQCRALKWMSGSAPSAAGRAALALLKTAPGAFAAGGGTAGEQGNGAGNHLHARTALPLQVTEKEMPEVRTHTRADVPGLTGGGGSNAVGDELVPLPSPNRGFVVLLVFLLVCIAAVGAMLFLGPTQPSHPHPH
jgi:hypothetical protein